jgi:hypothetical protein
MELATGPNEDVKVGVGSAGVEVEVNVTVI